MDRTDDKENQAQYVIHDPVCDMEVLPAIALRDLLYIDYHGTKYMFCSPDCLHVFQMNPQRFGGQQNLKDQARYCELCSKIIQDDDVSALTVRDTTYRFCCPECASVYLNTSQIYFTQPFPEPRRPGNMTGQLRQCGLLQWLEEAVERNASDLFLSVDEKPILKIYGVFRRLGDDALKTGQLHRIIQGITPEEKWAHFLEGNEVDIGLDVPGLARFRVNAFREQKGDAVAIRPIPHNIAELDELGLPIVFHDLSRLPRGLILVTGPAGSGKSTTLAALIDTINRREERHIITIEDPIEYVISSKQSLIHQREVGRHTGSFADGLRNALRENPDIIVVGELRDLESISLAIRAAETGHLVLGTLHSGTAIQAVTRVLDIFDTERQSQICIQLAQSLQAVCAQRLIKRRDGNGMVVATELLLATLPMRNIIRRKQIQELRGFMEFGKADGMYTLKQSIEALVDKGLVAPDALSGEESI